MADVNSCAFTGRLGRDPELTTTPDGVSICKFSLAVTSRRKRKDGQGYEADWLNVIVWRKTAEFAAEYLQKGSRCGISGSLQIRSWDGQDGQKKYVTEINATEVSLLDPKQKDPFLDDDDQTPPPTNGNGNGNGAKKPVPNDPWADED